MFDKRKGFIAGFKKLGPVNQVLTICTIISFLLALLAAIPNNPIRNFLSAKWYVWTFPKFDPQKEGILIGEFVNDKSDNSNTRGTLIATLNARFSELGIGDVDLKGYFYPHVNLISSHKTARQIGKTYLADFVIWGFITREGIIPNITLVDPKSAGANILRPDTTILKDELQFSHIEEQKEIRFPNLTDGITKLTMYVLGMQLFERKDYDGALNLFFQSLPREEDKVYIQSAPILHSIGDVYVQKNNFEKANEFYSKGLALNPNDAGLLNNLGLVYDKKGELDKALDLYSKALKLQPDNTFALNNRGVLYKQVGKYEKAKIDLEKASRLSPDDPSIYCNIGNLFRSMGKYDLAILNYNKALEFKFYLAETYLNRGIAYYAAGSIDEAILDYKKSIELKPDLALSYNNIGSIYVDLKDYDRAIPFYLMAIEKDPNYEHAYAGLSSAYQEKGDFKNAIINLKKAANFNPQWEYFHVLGDLYFHNHEPDEAIEYYSKALFKNANNYKIFNSRAIVHILKKQYDLGILDLKKSIEINPNWYKNYFDLAHAYDETNQKTDAIFNYEKFTTFSQDPKLIDIAHKRIQKLKWELNIDNNSH